MIRVQGSSLQSGAQLARRDFMQIGGAGLLGLGLPDRHVSDHYGDGAPYYIYNHESAGADRIVVCHETPNTPVIENPGCPVICVRFGEDGTCVR